MYSTKDFTLSLHKQCFGGAAQDYIIRFKKNEMSIEDIIDISSNTVIELIQLCQRRGKILKGRLIARVVYTSLLDDDTSVVYYHPSYSMETIHDAKRFYTEHMMKIARRMDNFNENGSNLIIDRIDEIHLHFSTIY